jgi:hypothetical protein
LEFRKKRARGASLAHSRREAWDQGPARAAAEGLESRPSGRSSEAGCGGGATFFEHPFVASIALTATASAIAGGVASSDVRS